MSALRPGLRVVIDTNLVLLALLFGGGKTAHLRHLWQAGDLRPLVSRVTVAELIRALAYPKFRLTAVEQHELLADYLPYCETVTVPNPPPRTPECRDPADAPFLELALAGEAEALVTGDEDLLTLAEPLGCPILRLEALLTSMSSHHRRGAGGQGGMRQSAASTRRRSPAVVAVPASRVSQEASPRVSSPTNTQQPAKAQRA